MVDTVSYSGLLVSLFLPWLTGWVWVRWILRNTGHWNWFIVMGQGYLIGVLAMTLLLGVWGRLGLPFYFWSIATSLGFLCALGLVLLKLHPPQASLRVEAKLQCGRWASAVVALLLALMAFRYATILQEMLLRPLYPWDAWMNWAPKAIVWFNQGEFTNWVSPSAWLASDPEAGNYTLGARGSWRYPEVIPLVQLWGMLGAGTSESNLILLPWFFLAISLGLTLFGYLKLAGAPTVVAVIASYLLMNLPYINVHTVLGGYADLWVAAAFSCAAFALYQWEKNRHPGSAVLVALLVLLCTQLKVPGLIFGAIVILAWLLTLLRAFKRPLVFYVFGLLLLVAVTLLIGVNIELPMAGTLKISMNGVTVPYIGSFNFGYNAIHEAMINTIFLINNWSLLWYFFVLMIVISPFWGVGADSTVSLRVNIALSLLFLFFVYYFTERYRFAEDYTQVNRALLCSVPVMIFFLSDIVRRYLARSYINAV